jgi:hypothetical protein
MHNIESIECAHVRACSTEAKPGSLATASMRIDLCTTFHQHHHHHCIWKKQLHICFQLVLLPISQLGLLVQACESMTYVPPAPRATMTQESDNFPCSQA